MDLLHSDGLYGYAAPVSVAAARAAHVAVPVVDTTEVAESMVAFFAALKAEASRTKRCPIADTAPGRFSDLPPVSIFYFFISNIFQNQT